MVTQMVRQLSEQRQSFVLHITLSTIILPDFLIISKSVQT